MAGGTLFLEVGDYYGGLLRASIEMNLLARVHGSMQALGGLVEAGVGGGATFYSGGSVAFIGIPVMVHGLDQFIAGMNTVITGEYRDTVTSQLLQATGISSDVAGFVDSGFSMVGTFGGTAILRAGQVSVFSAFNFLNESSISLSATNPLSAHLLKNKLIAQEISGGHAFEKHILNQGEFSGCSTRTQFAHHIENVLNNPSKIKVLNNGRIAYWHQKTGTVVIRNPSAIDGGTAFQPVDGIIYFETKLR